MIVHVEAVVEAQARAREQGAPCPLDGITAEGVLRVLAGAPQLPARAPGPALEVDRPPVARGLDLDVA